MLTPSFSALCSFPRDALTADLLGWTDKVGSIEPGKWADFVAVDGDPLQDVRTLENIKFVMKAGQIIRNDYAK